MKRSGLVLFLVLVSVSILIAASSSALAQGYALRVNAGAFTAYTDKAGNIWQPEKSYTKGSAYGFVGGDSTDRGESRKIEGASDPRIYQTEHYGMDNFVAEVPNGKYTVRLHFAETYEDITMDGPRVFDVKIQGAEALKDFDPSKAAGALFTPVVKELKNVEVSDGILKIDFLPKQQNPEVNGIEILAE